MYKLIAIDLDGTLLNSYGEISLKNKETIKKAIKKDINIVLASGRPIMSVKTIANEIEANNYMICGNGAITYDIQNEKIIYDQFMEKNKVLQIIKICEENSIYYNLYTQNIVLAKTLNYNLLFYNQENARKSDKNKTKIDIIKDIYKYVEDNNEKYLKITICDPDKIIFNSIIRKIKSIKNVDVLDVEHMAKKVIKDGTQSVEIEYFYTEIMMKDVDKWAALQNLCKKLDIKDDEIIAIGDNANDEKMIKNAGLGIAMGNSNPKIKSIADYICNDNNNDGVSEVIEKYCL